MEDKYSFSVTSTFEDRGDGLRPKRFDDFHGQTHLKEQLSVLVSAAKERGDSLDHVLFYGPPGLGKTTLATILAQEMNAPIRVTSGPAIERSGDLASLLTSLEEGDVLFIDEIHRLKRSVEELLYPALEDRAIDIVLGKGPSARTMRLDLPRFTLIGATTKAGSLSSPLRDRFGAVYRLSYYTASELQVVLSRTSALLGVEVVDEAVATLASRSRGTPRIANRLLSRIRDYAQIAGISPISADLVTGALGKMGVDDQGLTREDMRYLAVIIDKYKGGPVGVRTLAAALSEDEQTLEDVIEPFLMQLGMLKRTSQGREATDRAMQYLERGVGTDMFVFE